jgi:hypothetical protein
MRVAASITLQIKGMGLCLIDKDCRVAVSEV